MVGAGLAVLVNAREDGVFVAVDDERLTEPLGTTAYEVLIAESEAAPAVRVVLEPGVDLEVPVRARQVLLAVPTEHDRLLDADELVTDGHACLRRVFRRH